MKGYNKLCLTICGVLVQAHFAVAAAVEDPIEVANRAVKDLFAQTSTSSTEVFCGFFSTVSPNSSWQCRTINYLQDKNTRKPVNAFWMTFSAPSRFAGAQHYYIAVDPTATTFSGQYHVFSNGKFDLNPAVDEVYEDAKIEGSYGALSKISGLRMHILGTPKYGRDISIVVDGPRENMIIEGPIFDSYESNNLALTYHSHLNRQRQPSNQPKENPVPTLRRCPPFCH